MRLSKLLWRGRRGFAVVADGARVVLVITNPKTQQGIVVAWGTEFNNAEATATISA